MVVQSEDRKILINFPENIRYLTVKNVLEQFYIEAVIDSENRVILSTFDKRDDCLECIDAVYKSLEESARSFSFYKYKENYVNKSLEEILLPVTAPAVYLTLVESMLGKLYKHFKGSIVKVIAISEDPEVSEGDEGEYFITYKHIKDGRIWTRKLSNFNEKLDLDRIQQYGQTYRFILDDHDSRYYNIK